MKWGCVKLGFFWLFVIVVVLVVLVGVIEKDDGCDTAYIRCDE